MTLAAASCSRNPAPSRDAGAELRLVPARPDEVRFVAVGDTGEVNDGEARVARAMARTCEERGCDLALLLGDNLYEDGPSSVDDPQFEEKFEEPFAALDVPFYVVLGNHDYGGEGAGWDDFKADLEVARSARSKKWRMPARHWALDAGPVRFVGLDTNAQMYGDDASQRADATRWLAEASPWKVVLGHHPYLSNGDHGDAGGYDGMPSFVPVASGRGVRRFFEDVVCGRADLYLSGHDHSRQWLVPTCRGTELVVSGAGSKTTKLRGTHPVRFADTKLGFVWGRADRTSLELAILGDDGEVVFSRTLAKHE